MIQVSIIKEIDMSRTNVPLNSFDIDLQAAPEKLAGDSVRAVDRALEILLAFTGRDASADGQYTAAQLLKRLSSNQVTLSRPTLYRLLATLQNKGFVASAGEPQRFRLGPAVAKLGQAWRGKRDVITIAQPMMQSLWERTGETVALFLREGAERLCTAELPSANPLSFRRGIGYREQLAVGASGRVMLASMALNDTELAPFARTAKSTLQAYRKTLAAIEKKGFAVSKNELIDGAVAVAAPFFDGSGQVIGAVAVFGPSTRVKTEQIESYGGLLKVEARNISRALGVN